MLGAMKTAARMDSIGTETAFEVSARARALAAQGKSIVYLQIGEPDFDTPTNVREAAKQALDEGLTHYPPYPGLPELRAAIADDTTARRGFAPKPENVFVTVGGKGVMVYAIMALVEGLLRRLADVGRGVEVGLADLEVDHRATLGLERACPRADREGAFCPDRLHPGGDPSGG